MVFTNSSELLDHISKWGGYDIVYTDPPWALHKSIRKIRPNQQRPLDYHTMQMSDIKALHRDVICGRDKPCNVFMWCVESYLADAERMMNELGYTVHCRMVWDKGYGFAPAFTIRYTHEYLVWFYQKGKIIKPRQEARGKYRSVIVAPKGKRHSEKPECVYEMLEDMFPNERKLEMFARNYRNGWDSFGDELHSEEQKQQ